MALCLACGDCQTSPSTPEVLLPSLLVTRFTARARPLNEWVSSHCKARTLLWRPSRDAFTRRACSRLTARSHSCQSIWLQCSARPEDAHTDCSAFICNFPLRQFSQRSRDVRPAGSGLAFATA